MPAKRKSGGGASAKDKVPKLAPEVLEEHPHIPKLVAWLLVGDGFCLWTCFAATSELHASRCQRVNCEAE